MEADMPRKLYDQQYKTHAVLDPDGSTFLILTMHLAGRIADGLGSLKLAQTQGINKTAQNLGINPNMLGRWKREHETNTNQGRPVFTGRGVIALSEQEQEIQLLRKELEIARQERDILKKASCAACFT